MSNTEVSNVMSRRAKPKQVTFRRAGAALIVLAAVVTVGAWALWARGPAPSSAVITVEGAAFSTDRIVVASGAVSLTLDNTDAITHTFTVPSLGIDIEAAGGERLTAAAQVPPGQYQFICTIPGHDGPGMRGTLEGR